MNQNNRRMKKEEMIYLHLLLYQVKKFCEEKGLDCDFSKYNNLDISPYQVYRRTEDHKQAILVLAQELASMTMSKKGSVVIHLIRGVHE